MSTENLKLAKRLENALRCPVEWPDVGYLDEMPPYNNRLNFEWCADVCRVSVSNRETIIAEDWIIERHCDLEDDELLDAVINLEFTRNRAVELYMSGIGRLGGLRMLPPSHDSKDYRADLAGSEIVLATRSRPSLFYKNYSPKKLEEAFWLWFEHTFWVGNKSNTRVSATEPLIDTMFFDTSVSLWTLFLRQHNIRIAFDAVADVGASRGAPTSFVAVDISVDAKTAHAYPVLRAEAEQIMLEGNLFQQRIY